MKDLGTPSCSCERDQKILIPLSLASETKNLQETDRLCSVKYHAGTVNPTPSYGQGHPDEKLSLPLLPNKTPLSLHGHDLDDSLNDDTVGWDRKA